MEYLTKLNLPSNSTSNDDSSTRNENKAKGESLQQHGESDKHLSRLSEHQQPFSNDLARRQASIDCHFETVTATEQHPSIFSPHYKVATSTHNKSVKLPPISHWYDSGRPTSCEVLSVSHTSHLPSTLQGSLMRRSVSLTKYSRHKVSAFDISPRKKTYAFVDPICTQRISKPLSRLHQKQTVI